MTKDALSLGSAGKSRQHHHRKRKEIVKTVGTIATIDQGLWPKWTARKAPELFGERLLRR